MVERQQSQWLLYAAASGACAALNGAFAKLTTTTTLTSTWATALSRLLPNGDKSAEYVAEGAIRVIFLALNIIFNGVMWALFTRALTLADSTVRVSVINTSANFVITAVLGTVVFGESLPGLWWVGAVLLVAGSVIIGRRDEGGDVAGTEERTKGSGSNSEIKAADSPRVLRSQADAATFELDEHSHVRQRKPK